MLERIVEVAEEGRHLRVERGFLVIAEGALKESEVGRTPLDDLGAVIVNARGVTYTNSLLAALASRGVPLVVCGQYYNAIGVLLSLEGHYEQSRRIDAQLDAAQPVHKQLWASIVRRKLEMQAAALDAVGEDGGRLRRLVVLVRSGDRANVEAQGARHYWPTLFGSAFRRNRNADGVNALLNYGYTVIRTAMTRSVVAAGLHPSIGLHHRNDGNPMRLVDDLVEPFRPAVDIAVWRLQREGVSRVSSDAKRALVAVLHTDVQTAGGTRPFVVCMHRLALSLAQCYLGDRNALELPPAAIDRAVADPNVSRA